MEQKKFKATQEECQKEAAKYKKRKEFEQGSGKHYRFALSQGWMDEVCSHMEFRFRNFEDVKQRSKGYAKRTHFFQKDRAAYDTALRRGWLDELFPQKFA